VVPVAYRIFAAVVIGNKYRRALKIKAGLPALQDAMRSLDVESRDVFEMWLAKEKQYLRSLSKEPAEETLEMEYYQKLVNWQDHEYAQKSVYLSPTHPWFV
jgi:hypothetical protein